MTYQFMLKYQRKFHQARNGQPEECKIRKNAPYRRSNRGCVGADVDRVSTCALAVMAFPGGMRIYEVLRAAVVPRR
jgi:hypothetical protein